MDQDCSLVLFSGEHFRGESSVHRATRSISIVDVYAAVLIDSDLPDRLSLRVLAVVIEDLLKKHASPVELHTV